MERYMMTYVRPIVVAFIAFPFIALLIVIPYMIYNYRKYGAVSKFRSLVIFSFILYLVVVYLLAVFPLPSVAEVLKMSPKPPQLQPFRFITDFVRDTGFDLYDTTTWWPAMKSPEFFEPVCNVLFTIPLGIYLKYYFKRGFVMTTLLSFCFSLFLELTQLSGLYGYYPRPYRLFSVDDLILNTLGGVLGFFIGFLVTAVLPSKQSMDRVSYKRSSQVGYTRHLFSVIIDLAVLQLVWYGVSIGLQKEIWYLKMLLYVGYFIGFSLLGGGRTLGKLIVNIKVAPSGKMNFLLAVLLRYGLLFAVYFGREITGHLPLSIDPVYRSMIGNGVHLLGLVLFGGSWLIGFFTKKRLWYEKFSRTELVSTFRKRR